MNADNTWIVFKYFIDNMKNQKKGFYPIIIEENDMKNPELEFYMKEFDMDVGSIWESAHKNIL